LGIRRDHENGYGDDEMKRTIDHASSSDEREGIMTFKRYFVTFDGNSTLTRRAAANQLCASAKLTLIGLLLLLLNPLLVAAQDQGGIWHTIRAADRTWQIFGDVKGQAGDPGFVYDVAAAGDTADGNLQVLAVANPAGTTTTGLWHTIRAADGTWQLFGDVEGQAGDPGNVTKVASAVIGCDLHVVVSTFDGGLWHAIRFCDGTWQPFGDVKGQAGDPGPVTDVSASGNSATGELNVVASTADGGLWHTIRAADGSWQLFGYVKAQAGDPGSLGAVASALIGCNLHVASATAHGLWHTIRFCDGTWQQFGNIKAQAGDPGDFLDLSIAGNNATGELHVVGSTNPFVSAEHGGPWHTIRAADGTWQPFGDVGAQAGRPGCGIAPVHATLIGGSLHVIVSTVFCPM
jgi:hypothetical protein